MLTLDANAIYALLVAKGRATNLWPWVRMSIAGITLLFLTACGVDEMRWQEEVWLHDDSRILVDRSSTRRSSGFPNERRGAILTQEFRYAPLGVAWSEKGGWEQLLSFDIVEGVPYLIAIAPIPKEKFCADKEKGEYVAVYYRWIDGKQERISRDQTPISIMRSNVTGVSHWGSDRRRDRSFLSWRDVLDATGQPWTPPPMLLTEMFAKKSWLRC